MTSPKRTEISEIDYPSVAGKGLGNFASVKYALLFAALAAVGSYSILPVWLSLFRLWLNDPLRAIGAIFPLLACAGTLAAWRRIGWSANGTFWGLPLLAASVLLARVTTSLIVAFRFYDHNESVLHPGLVMFLYGVGAVLLFGGARLLRGSIAPLCLLLLVDPVPHSFNALVDLPLQYLSANTARHFAYLIGLQPTGEQLRMMFTPDFGMMIVPGCNGVRGSITLAYLALIFGYFRHLRPHTLALTTLGAFLMGYVLNLVRLCTLVIYYRIGVSIPSIQPYGAGVDYAIGCTLFLIATSGVGIFIRSVEPKPQTTDDVVRASNLKASTLSSELAMAARTGCFVALMLVFIVPTFGTHNSFHIRPNEQALLEGFPSQVGSYRLVRTYAEHDNEGLLRFVMGDYSTPPDGANPVNRLSLGIYVGMDTHYVAFSRFTQGIRPDWTGTLDGSDASVQRPLKVHFVTTLYDDGISRQFNAESTCYETGCSASIDSGPGKMFFSAPAFSDVVSASSGNRLTILLRREWPDSDTMPVATQRAQFEADIRHFTEQLDLTALLRQDGLPI